jgi:hypothetical protein
VQDPGQGQAAQACSDDGDARAVHGSSRDSGQISWNAFLTNMFLLGRRH